MKSQFSWTLLLLVGLASCAFAQNNTAKDHYKKGEYYLSNADYDLAITSFSMAIKLDSTDVNYFLQRGFCYNILKKHDEAVSDFTTAIQLNPENKFAFLSRGSAKNKIGAFESAIADFDKVLLLDPSDQEAYNNRGFSKKQLGDHKGACEDWKTSKKMGNKEAPIILKNNNCK